MAISRSFAALVGRCEAMEGLKASLLRFGPTDLRVHVCGETGTGKELVARALHELSPRAGRKFVAVNLAGFSDELFAAELFGHARGAFTGAVAAREGFVAEAEGGTLFIDEVGELSPLSQVRLLRFLQEREYQRLGETLARHADVRVISATNVDLERRVREGRFRDDLRFRLRHERLRVPPLRERGADVLLLARSFLRARATTCGTAQPVLGPEAEALLLRHAWPGNVRQLEGEMKRLSVVAAGRLAVTEDFSAELQAAPPGAAGGLRELMRLHEIEHVRRALDRHGWVQARAAAELGITRQALCAKLRRLGLVDRERPSTVDAA
jgi:DNA-binding NtrC family response regulator